MPSIKSPTKVKTLDEIREFIKKSRLADDPELVLKDIDLEFQKKDGGNKVIDFKSIQFKALTLVEFESGILMWTVVPELYRTFALDFMRQLQNEYDCKSPSEKSLTELLALNYVRILEIQRKMDNYMTDSLSGADRDFFALLSKELDRANRQYLSTLQTLKMMKQPVFSVNVKANTAIVGQNQLIQENQNVNPI